MKNSENGLSFIRREEGERLMAYADVIGVWTIGVGHTGTVDGISITKGMTTQTAPIRRISQFSV